MGNRSSAELLSITSRPRSDPPTQNRHHASKVVVVVDQRHTIDIPGVAIGHWTSPGSRSGCTVLLFPDGATAGAHVVGTPVGTQEFDLLRSGGLVQRINGILIAGGTAFGLAAVPGVMRYLDERGIGFVPDLQDSGRWQAPTDELQTNAPIPILVSTSISDGAPPSERPDESAGYAACMQSSTTHTSGGRIGAGAASRMGTLNGDDEGVHVGIGWAKAVIDAAQFLVLTVPNCAGLPMWYPGIDDWMGPQVNLDSDAWATQNKLARPIGEVVVVVITDLPIEQSQASALATAAYSGIAQSIRPLDPFRDACMTFAVSTRSNDAGRIMSPQLGRLVADLVGRSLLDAAGQVNVKRPQEGWPGK